MSCSIILCPHKKSDSRRKFLTDWTEASCMLSPVDFIAPKSDILPVSGTTSASINTIVFIIIPLPTAKLFNYNHYILFADIFNRN
jgi:hypothetical protein